MKIVGVEGPGELQNKGAVIEDGAVIEMSDLLLVFVPSDNESGEVTIRYQVSTEVLAGEAIHYSEIGTMNVVIEAVNDAPVLVSGYGIELDEGESYEIHSEDIASYMSDVEGNELSLRIHRLSSGVMTDNTGVVIGSGDDVLLTQLPLTYRSEVVGSDRIDWQVSDGALYSAVIEIPVTVNNVDTLPEIMSDPSEVATEGVTYQYRFAYRDADLIQSGVNEALTVEIMGAPELMTRQDEGIKPGEETGYVVFEWRPENTDVGFSYDIEIGVSDLDEEIYESEEAVKVSLRRGLPSWLLMSKNSSGNQEIVGDATNGDVGSYTIEVMATDANGEVVTGDYTLTVENRNDVPKILTTGVQEVTENKYYRYEFEVEDADF
jgi:hypothetical protein